MKKDEPRARGRPRAFDKETALKAAIEVFWREGYANASLDELTSAMKISRPSLYAAFGDKEGLFKASLKVHGDSIIQRMQNVAKDKKTGAEIIRTIYFGAIDIYTHKAPVPRGCLFAAASLSDVTMSEDLRHAVAQQLNRLVHNAEQIFEAYPSKGLKPAQAAQLFSTCLFGFAVRARLGEPADGLKKDAEAMVTRLFPNK